ncbi:type III-A CRISPR-associated protein Cas10/Csm1 [Chlorobium phaeobacteroides]|uniref:CRISPR system single-strand-specific deoxyribonuclease Cas10/Csm1 (subtype III-A) n=1 Tax=Chlorobium phaeobacteroides (strain DSM 266 / SMG 266 / 2430) TaxID=290317 RepID=A1BI35_CHLPD|nr:type III-A CRISPR-associated protein Cas10/Csm1 [Chlorobium phaeobacteroides]ABL66062.1 CRISPR-associated protein, Csm1 family [Chlorobium phaeobacteroides DSM 266]
MTTSITGNDIIKLGFDLLREGTLSIVDIVDAFKLAGIQSTELKLSSLKSPFGGDRFFEPKQLSATEINYPVYDRVTDFSEIIPQDDDQGLTALERLGSFVATDADEKYSVFDLFKTVAAIQDCLRNPEEDKPFLLVSADFSGIQDTVYTISSKGALKTLRARSFMLELLTEHIIYEILSEVESERYAVVFSGGGGFGLLLPNSEESIRTINDYRTRINEWAFDEFSGRFFIAMDALPFGREELLSGMSFRNIRQTQADNLDRLKRRKFIDQFEQLFTPSMPKQLTVNTECQITRRDDMPDEFMFDLETETRMSLVPAKEREDDKWIWVSESCYHQFWIGDKLATAQSVVRSQKTPEGKEPYFKYPDATWSKENKSWVYYQIDDQQTKSADCWFMNDWTAGQPILYANYVRKHGELSEYAKKLENESLKEENPTAKPNHTATFQGLAASSCGADLIGALRMDVDDMGNLFSSIGSLTELSAKSRMLNLFFKVYLNQICAANLGGGFSYTDIAKKNYSVKNSHGDIGRNVSVIYAGGDDLFILGAWDETTELAFDIQRCFSLFTGETLNKEKKTVVEGLGISGGLTLHQPKFPLYQMAQKSGEAEHGAKNDIEIQNAEIEKNRISLFFDDSKRQCRLKIQEPYRYMLSMKWDLSSAFLLPLMKTYRECGNVAFQDGRMVLEIEKFSYQTIEKWFAVIEKYQESSMLYLPTMARVMKQVEENPRMDASLFKTLLGFLYTNDESKKNWISHLHVALNWLTYLRRKN